MKKAVTFLLLHLSLIINLRSQENVSAATGVSVLRNFSPQQGFWSVGHTLQVNVHFSPAQSAYAWLEYYTDGRYKNNFTAAAKSPSASPQQLPFTASGKLAYRHFSLGWKHYFKGSYQGTKALNVYGLAGFGFLFANVQNDFSASVDTALYSVSTKAGSGTVKKLSFDLGLGGERALGNNLFLFADLRSWLPASSNVSLYLHNQRNVPLPFMLSAGLRVLIGPVND